MFELKPGHHYFLAIQRGSYKETELQILVDGWAKADITVYILRTYDMPINCMAFTEKEQEVA